MYILDTGGNTEWAAVVRRYDVQALTEQWRATTLSRARLPAQRRLDEMRRQLAAVETELGLLTR